MIAKIRNKYLRRLALAVVFVPFVLLYLVVGIAQHIWDGLWEFGSRDVPYLISIVKETWETSIYDR